VCLGSTLTSPAALRAQGALNGEGTRKQRAISKEVQARHGSIGLSNWRRSIQPRNCAKLSATLKSDAVDESRLYPSLPSSYPRRQLARR
jgi:hypothetical protein